MADPNLYLLKFNDHTEYLNSFINPKDIMYVRSRQTLRQFIKLGYQTAGAAPYTEAEFLRRVTMAKESLKTKEINEVFSKYMSPNNTDPVLLEYKKREIPIYTKNLAVRQFEIRRSYRE